MNKKPIAERDPVFVAAGLKGAAKRWGASRNVSLFGLTAEQRVFVTEMVRDLRAAAEAQA